MSKVTSVLDTISHRAGLLKELKGKSPVRQTEIMLRETRGIVADEVLSKEANDAIKASLTPKIKKSSHISEEFKSKFAKIKESRKYSEMQKLITETDSIPLLEYIQKNIYIDGNKHASTANQLKKRAEYKVIVLKCAEYKTKFLKDRTRFYKILDNSLEEALQKGSITKRKANELKKYYRDSADERIMYSILSHEDKFVFPNSFDETNSAVLELRLRLMKELEK